MRQTTVHGVEIKQGDTCAYCHLNTAGQHEPGCPLHPHAIVWTPEGAMPLAAVGDVVVWDYRGGQWAGRVMRHEANPVVVEEMRQLRALDSQTMGV